MVNIELTNKEYRRLLDMVYIGNWILNSTRENDRFIDYDNLESKVFSKCETLGLDQLYSKRMGWFYPSQAFENGGIHEAIKDYEDTVFYEILAEELARRDIEDESLNTEDAELLTERVEEYLADFEENGMTNVYYEK
ncbi:MAG: hypothetical protein IKI49_01715 [Oscillospiraceae bacterium]|nr:hypothetical protein [Oscillospiraceae bacterium]